MRRRPEFVRHAFKVTAWVHGADPDMRNDEKWTVPEFVPLSIDFGPRLGIARLTREGNGDITARVDIICERGDLVDRLIGGPRNAAVSVRAGVVNGVAMLTRAEPMERKKENMIESITSVVTADGGIIRRYSCVNNEYWSDHAEKSGTTIAHMRRTVGEKDSPPPGWTVKESAAGPTAYCPECSEKALATEFGEIRTKEREEHERARREAAARELILRGSETFVYRSTTNAPAVKCIARAVHRPTGTVVFRESGSTGTEAVAALVDLAKEALVQEVSKLPGYGPEPVSTPPLEF